MLYYQVKKADQLFRREEYTQTVANELFAKRVYLFFGARFADAADIAPATV